MTDLDEGALQEARSGLQDPGKHRILPIDLSEVERVFQKGIREIRELEQEAFTHQRYFEENRMAVVEAVHTIIQKQ
jgi:hypothetical protein